jgi:hypothetical protein
MALLEAFVAHHAEETISGEFRHEEWADPSASNGITSGNPAGVKAWATR